MPERVPSSFAHATIEPVNVSAPTAMPMPISTRCTVRSAPACSNEGALGERYDAKPTSTAARPTKLWRMATSSGMPVISTRRASEAPTAPPITSAATRSDRRDPALHAPRHPGGRRDEDGDAHADDAVGATALRSLLLREAAEAADEENTRHQIGDGGYAVLHSRPRRNIRSMRSVTRKPPAMLIAAKSAASAPSTDATSSPATDLQHSADDDDAADRVGDAHERRVQRRSHAPDDLPADEAREDEDRRVLEEVTRREAPRDEEHEDEEEPADGGAPRAARWRADVLLRGLRDPARAVAAVSSSTKEARGRSRPPSSPAWERAQARPSAAADEAAPRPRGRRARAGRRRSRDRCCSDVPPPSSCEEMERRCWRRAGSPSSPCGSPDR